jgi:hypothetical protein
MDSVTECLGAKTMIRQWLSLMGERQLRHHHRHHSIWHSYWSLLKSGLYEGTHPDTCRRNRIRMQESRPPTLSTLCIIFEFSSATWMMLHRYAVLSSMHNLCSHHGSSACLDAPGRLFIGHGHDGDVSRIFPREAAIRAASKSIFDCREPASQSAREWI